MPANIPEKAKAQWDRVAATKDPKEKLKELQKFKSMVPRHKGTENMLMQVKRKMARLRREISDSKRSKTSTFVSVWNQPKHGAARIALVGFLGQSLAEAFRALTGQRVWPRELYEPHFGMLEGGHVQFQLVVLPPLTRSDALDEKTFNLCRDSDMVLYLDEGRAERFYGLARDHGILPKKPKGSVELERVIGGGIRIVGRAVDATQKDIIRLLEDYRIRNAIVTLSGEATLEDVENAILETWKYVPTVSLRLEDGVIAVDADGENHRFPDSDGLSAFILDQLSMIRIYTKVPGQKAAENPVLLKKGSQVEDLTKEIHSYLAKNFRYALIWRDEMDSPLRVSKSYQLEDGDIVEIRAR